MVLMFLIKVGVDKINYEYLCVELQQLVYCQRNRKGVKMIEKAELKRIYNFATSKKRQLYQKHRTEMMKRLNGW